MPVIIQPAVLKIKDEHGQFNNANCLKGDAGTTFTPAVSEEGVISWSNNDGKTNPSSVNIKGPKGDTGATGPQGPAGADGQDGAPGADGQDGVSAYVWITYSANQPTQDSDMTSTPSPWMGIYAGTSSTAPTHYTDYTWYKIKGADGQAVLQDVQINGTSILDNGVANVPLASRDNFGLVKLMSDYGVDITTIGQFVGVPYVAKAPSSSIKAGANQYRPVVPYNQHESAFYALAKLAGADMANSNNTVGTYTEAALEAIQMLFGLAGIFGDYEASSMASKAYAIGETFVYNGKRYRATAAIAISDVIAPGTNCVLDPIDGKYVRNTDYALNNGDYGLVKLTSGSYGVMRANDGFLMVAKATESQIKAGENANRPIVPQYQHESAFYGLAKAAGDISQASSANTVGTYTQNAKTAIQTMLGIEADIPLVETVTGATASITGMPNVRYICDTAISELTITPPASGSIVVRFTAGSNCIVSLPQTVKLPEWFDISSLEAGTTYEIIITDGVYGGVMSWA